MRARSTTLLRMRIGYPEGVRALRITLQICICYSTTVSVFSFVAF